MTSRKILLMLLTFVMLWALAFHQPSAKLTQMMSDQNPPENGNVLNTDMHPQVFSHETTVEKVSAYNISNLDLSQARAGVINEVETQIQVNSSNTVVNITLAGGYYLNLTTFRAYVNNSVQGDFNLTHTLFDVDMDLLYPNGSVWHSSQSNSYTEVIGPVEVPFDGEYTIILYPFENEFYQLDTVLQESPINVTAGQYEVVYYSNETEVDLYIQVLDHATAILGSDINFDRDEVQTYLGRMPEVLPGISSYLWEHQTDVNWFSSNGVPFYYSENNPQLIGLDYVEPSTAAHTETFKLWMYEGSEVQINVTYDQEFNVTNYPVTETNFPIAELVEAANYTNYVADYRSYEGGASISSIGKTTSDLKPLDFSYELDSVLEYTPAKNNLKNTTNGLFLLGHSVRAVANSTGWYVFNLESYVLDSAEQTTRFRVETEITDRFDVSPASNDIPDEATNLGNMSTVVDGLTINESSPDFYNITAPQNSRLVVDLVFDKNHGEIGLYVFDDAVLPPTSNETEAYVTSSLNEDVNQQRVTVLVFSFGSYYLKINTSQEYGIWYNLSVSIEPIDDDYEPNEHFAQARALPGKGNYDLFLKKYNQDYFYVFLMKGDTLSVMIEFNGSNANLNLYLYNHNFDLMNKSVLPGSSVEEASFVAETSEIYLIRIYAFSTGFIVPGLDYSLTISIDEVDDALEPNDKSNEAKVMQDGNFEDLILRSGDEDWFRIYMLSGESLTAMADFNPQRGDLDLILYDAEASVVLKQSQSFESTENISFVANSDGEVLLRVVLFDGWVVPYSLNLTLNDESNDQYEDNDQFNEAFKVEAGVYTDVQSRGGDYDFYQLVIPKDYALIAELTFVIGQDFWLGVYSPEQALIVESDSELNTERVGPFGVLSEGSYFITVYQKTPGLTSYNLNLTLGLTQNLVQPPFIQTGNWVLPQFGFNSSLINVGGTTVVTTQTSTTNTTTTSGGLNIGQTVTFTTIGLGLGGGAGVGGSLIINRMKKP